MWGPPSAPSGRQSLNYGVAEMGGIVGLRDLFVVAPASSFHPHNHPHQESLYSSAADHPIIPLLTASPCLMGDDPHDPRGKSIHLWQHHLPPQNPNPNNPYLKRPMPMLDSAGILGSGSTATCQDCGNQAKKDCSHQRCRTCCKSRGFDCTTHVKSTWVPASRRRERQISAAAHGATAGSSASTSAPKKPRLLSSQTTTTSRTSTSNNTTHSYDTSSSQRDASFRENLPGHVRAPAVFKCVRVSSVEEDGEDEYAYQATVKIGGHVFKGFLYNQGIDDGREEHTTVTVPADGTDSKTNDNAIPNLSELHLGGRSVATSSSAMVTSDMYGGGGLLGGGTTYGNPIN